MGGSNALMQYLRANNYVDARALGMFRVLLGLVLTVKFLGTIPRNFTNVFSPESGLLGNCFSEGYVATYKSHTLLFNVHADAGLWAFALFTGAVMLALMLGVYPRAMAAIGSILLWLWNDRFQMVWFGWEQYAQVLLFVAIFLPTDARLSLFRSRNAGSDGLSRATGSFVFLALLQIAMIYFYNGLSKNGDRWWDGSAIQFSLGFGEMNGAATWLIQQDFLCKLLTFSTLAWEIGFPILLFLPVRSPWPRVLAALSIPAFHWGLSIFMDVGDFKYVSLAACALLLPSMVYDRLPQAAQKAMQWHWRKLPSPSIRVPAGVTAGIAGLLIAIMVLSNLKQSLQSKSQDRLKDWLGGGAVEQVIKTIYPDGMPRYSFFGQHWHLFSPNPPGELGNVWLEMHMPDGRTQRTFSGQDIVDTYPTKTARFLMRYLSYDRENMKSNVFANCMMQREAKLWHDNHKGQNAKHLSLVIFSWRPKNLEALKAGAEGQLEPHELLGFTFKYNPEGQ